MCDELVVGGANVGRYTVSQIPFALYDVYVYADSDATDADAIRFADPPGCLDRLPALTPLPSPSRGWWRRANAQ